MLGGPEVGRGHKGWDTGIALLYNFCPGGGVFLEATLESQQTQPLSPLPVLPPHCFPALAPLLHPNGPLPAQAQITLMAASASHLVFLPQFSSPKTILFTQIWSPPTCQQTNQPTISDFLPLHESQFSSIVVSWILPKCRAVLSNAAKDLPNLLAGLKMRTRYTGTK